MNVIIIDDSELVRERVAESISELPGIHVTGFASNSIEALEIVESKKPEVIILDIKIPGENGIEVLKRIKKLHTDIKVIMLTNYPFLQYRSKCYESGADYFLDKSNEFEKLGDVLMEIEKHNYKKKIMWCISV